MANNSIFSLGNLSIGDEVKDKIIIKPFGKLNLTINANISEEQKKEIISELELRFKKIFFKSEEEKIENIDFLEDYFEKIYKEILKQKILKKENDYLIKFLDFLLIDNVLLLFQKMEIIQKVKYWNEEDLLEIIEFYKIYWNAYFYSNKNQNIFLNLRFYNKYLKRFNMWERILLMQQKHNFFNIERHGFHNKPIGIQKFYPTPILELIFSLVHKVLDEESFALFTEKEISEIKQIKFTK